MTKSLPIRVRIGRILIRSRKPASSVIDYLDYNWLTRRLRITFKHGEVYDYRGVPSRVARELETASDGAGSVGRVFNVLVRDRYSYKRAA
jgi:hypothetical protein